MSRFWHLLEDFFPSYQFFNVPVAVNLDSQTTQIKIGSELVFNEPTCLTWQKNSQQVLNFGSSAYRLLGKTSDAVEVVFPLAKNKVKINLLTVFLKSVLAKVSHTVPGHLKHLDIFLGVESNLLLSHATTLQQILQKIPAVGAVALIPRLEAAYHTLWHQKKVGLQTGLILFSEAMAEVGIFADGKLVVANQIALGKDRFIDLVMEQVRINYQLEIGRETAAQIWQEIALVSTESAEGKPSSKPKDLQMVIRGKHIVTHLPTTSQVSSHDLYAGINLVLIELLQVIKQTFNQVSPELMGGILEKGLTITGGVSMRGLENYLIAKLHCPVIISSTAQNDVLNGLLLAGKTRKKS